MKAGDKVIRTGISLPEHGVVTGGMYTVKQVGVSNLKLEETGHKIFNTGYFRLATEEEVALDVLKKAGYAVQLPPIKAEFDGVEARYYPHRQELQLDLEDEDFTIYFQKQFLNEFKKFVAALPDYNP